MKILLFGSSIANNLPISSLSGHECQRVVAPSGYWYGSKRPKGWAKRLFVEVRDSRLVISNPWLIKRANLDHDNALSYELNVNNFDLVVCGLPHFFGFSTFQSFTSLDMICPNDPLSFAPPSDTLTRRIVLEKFNYFLEFAGNLIEACASIPLVFLATPPGNYYHYQDYKCLSKFFMSTRSGFLSQFNSCLGSRAIVLDIYRYLTFDDNGFSVLNRSFSRPPCINNSLSVKAPWVSPLVYDMGHPLYGDEYDSLVQKSFGDLLLELKNKAAFTRLM
jgi:hypothetical protein